MANRINKSILDFLYNAEMTLSNSDKGTFIKRETDLLLLTPLKVISLLIAVSGLFAMVFEVRHFSQYSTEVYITRLIATLIAFTVLVLLNTSIGLKKPVQLVHLLLITIICSSGYMIYLIPSTLIVNSQIVGLMIFTSALFLSWEVKNQIIVAIYYNLVFAFAILMNDTEIYFLPNMFESVLFVIFLSIVSVIGSAVNYKLRLELAEKTIRIEMSEKKYRSIFDHALEGMFQTSLDGEFLAVNKALVKILGYKSEDELKNYKKAIDFYENPKERENLIKILNENGEVIDYRLKLKRKDGSIISVRINDKLVIDEDDPNIKYYEGSIQDITEEVRLDEEKRQALLALKEEKLKSDELAKEALALSRSKSQFLANMSHEIRTPMNGILGYLNLIQNESYQSQAELSQFVKNAKDSAESLLDIINSILDFSKIEAGKFELERINFDLMSVIDESIVVVSTRAKEKELKIIKLIQKNIPTQLNGDPTRLRQIFINLLSNAIKFTEQGEIKIILRGDKEKGNQLKLYATVEDSGMGIPESKMKELFLPFSQLDSSNTRKYGGTGLGLVICKEIVTMMDGEIWVESEIGKGSKFHFISRFGVQESDEFVEVLPILKVEKQELEVEDEVAKPTEDIKRGRRRFKLLLAEDNTVNQKVATRILNDAGYNVDPVGNGAEALKAVQNGNYDLVLMDVQMPEMDGFTATQTIRGIQGDKSKIPIIALTAHALTGDREKCLEIGMNDYITKPINSKELLKILDKWLSVQPLPEEERPEPEEKPVQKEIIFDLEHFDQISMGNVEFQRDLLLTYLEDIPKRIERLEVYIKTNETQNAIREAHTIKGSSYSLGAKKLGDDALAIEIAAKREDLLSSRSKLTPLKISFGKTENLIKEKFSI